MKAIIYSLAIISLICKNSYSQKIDLDKELWAHSYSSLPKSKDLENLNTYAVIMFANMDNLNRMGLSADKIETAFKLDGYVYTTDPADILIEVTIENLRKNQEEVRTKESTVYEGGKNVTKKVFIPATSYVIPTSVRIVKGPDMEELMNIRIGGDQNPVEIGSGEFPTYEAANAAFNGTEEKRFESIKEKYFSLLSAQLNGFKEKYDFAITNETDIFWHVDLKKNPEFTEFNGKLTAAKEIFASQKASDDIKVTREKLSATLQYLRENADKVVGTDKNNKKLKYAYLINLGKTQLWLEMLDECAVTAQQIIDNDYDKADGKTLLRAANTLGEELKNSSNSSRHLPRNGFTSTTHFSASEIKPLQSKTNAPVKMAGLKSSPAIVAATIVQQNKGVRSETPATPVAKAAAPVTKPTAPASPVPVVLTEAEIKKDLDIIFTFETAENLIGGGFILPGEYVYDQDKKLSGQKFIHDHFPDRYIATNEGVLSVTYYNNKIGSVHSVSGCQVYNTPWYDFEITYNDQNKISKIAKPWMHKGNSKQFIRSWYVFSYEGNHLVKLSENQAIGEGNIKSPKVLNEYQDRSVTINWKSDNEPVVTYFETKRKPKEPDVVVTRGTTAFRVNKGSTFSESGTGNVKNSREEKVIGNQLILTTIDGSLKDVTTSDLDEKGRIVKVTFIRNKDGQGLGKAETTVKYVPKDANPSSNDSCNSDVKNIVNVFDASGALIQESTDTQMRVRNADGTWGPWKSYTY